MFLVGTGNKVGHSVDFNAGNNVAFTVSETGFLDEAPDLGNIDPSYMTVLDATTLDNWWGQEWMSTGRAKYDNICT